MYGLRGFGVITGPLVVQSDSWQNFDFGAPTPPGMNEPPTTNPGIGPGSMNCPGSPGCPGYAGGDYTSLNWIECPDGSTVPASVGCGTGQSDGWGGFSFTNFLNSNGTKIALGLGVFLLVSMFSGRGRR